MSEEIKQPIKIEPLPPEIEVRKISFTIKQLGIICGIIVTIVTTAFIYGGKIEKEIAKLEILKIQHECQLKISSAELEKKSATNDVEYLEGRLNIANDRLMKCNKALDDEGIEGKKFNKVMFSKKDNVR